MARNPLLNCHLVNYMQAVLACRTCELVQRVEPPGDAANAICARCGARLRANRRFSLACTGAFSLAALFLYIPANVLPIMRMTYMGRISENTVWGGCRQLAHHGSVGIAVIVFAASILIPLIKLLGLLFLVLTAGSGIWQIERARILRVLEISGRWSMLDVFLLAILVAIVKLGDFATVVPGPGISFFAAMVILTMLASACFDARVIWDESDDGQE